MSSNDWDYLNTTIIGSRLTREYLDVVKDRSENIFSIGDNSENKNVINKNDLGMIANVFGESLYKR